ncbi:MAG: hypothetical protein II664_01925 [Oscillospiraceae bacterium]|nr:hypothetical protein [Oscillospiraceae bacterium]
MKSKNVLSALLAAAVAFTGMAPLTASAATAASYSKAYVRASEAKADDECWLDDVIASSGYNVDYTTRYAYKKLSSSEKQLYKLIVRAVRNLDPAIEIPDGLKEAQVFKVYNLVFHEEPQLFWMDDAYNPSTNLDYLLIRYKTTDYQEITEMQEKINKTAKSLLSKANKKKATVNKIKVFYDYIVLHNKSVMTQDGFNSSIYNGLTGGESLRCSGYAKTMQYLCDLAGIKCMVVPGENDKGESHAWNKVYCGDGWYNLDPTWGDPIRTDLNSTKNSTYIQYEYFLVPDSWIEKYTHFNTCVVKRKNGSKVKLFAPPACTKTKYNYFIYTGKNYTTLSKAKSEIRAQIKEAVKEKKTVVEIRVSTKSLFDKLTGATYGKSFETYAKGLSSNVSKLTKYTKYQKGVYVVHYDIVYKN